MLLFITRKYRNLLLFVYRSDLNTVYCNDANSREVSGKGPDFGCHGRGFGSRPRGYKTLFMLNSAEHDFFLLINVKMPTIVGILTFMSTKNSILGFSGPEKY